MSNVEVMDTLYQMFQLVVRLALPLLLISMIVGIIIAIFQAATQISEQTLTFVPKLLALLVTLSVLGGSMLNSIHEFMIMIFNMIAEG
ncbi:MAG: flagellar type III secretion system protein FliQ [Lachnospiraceae bacterium]|nr:flagellar type III secretion system protein FliQ [Lachnospiraceae bacterium]